MKAKLTGRKKKPSPLIISDKGKKYGRELIIKKLNRKQEDGITKLSDVFCQMPCGFVYKDETGMGATTLEFLAKRNSIIVEPIKITASSKANEHGALYVGSATRYHPKKVTTRTISDYIKNPEIPFKKIVVVADSLEKVIKVIGDSVFENYFLLIDEIDSFQLDSVYRRRMEECLDYYKRFNEKNRAMLSASRIDFTDPDLKGEEVTFIRYDNPGKRKINIISTLSNKIQGIAFDTILQITKKFSENKILVAYNTVNGCYNLAASLANSGIADEDISILCSVTSKEKVKEYYQELNSDELPSRVNFITSAYFTGFDLKERFHLISISGNRSNVQALSDRRLKQIAGRCRAGLLSETIIHDIASLESFKEYTAEELIEAATEQVRAWNCMNKHYKQNRVLQLILEDVNEKFMKLLDDRQSRYFINEKGKDAVISYLNIDSKLEAIRVRKELYLNPKSLTNKLIKDGHEVTILKRTSKTVISDSKVSQQYRDKKVQEVISQLKKVKNLIELKICCNDKALITMQKNIALDFAKLYGFLDQGSILNKMEESLLGQRDNRKYNALLISAHIQTISSGHLVIDRLRYYFKVGAKYTSSEILDRMNLFFAETTNLKKLGTPREAVRMLNNLRKTYRKRSKDDGTIYYHIKNDNPQKIVSVKKRKPLDQAKLFTTIFNL